MQYPESTSVAVEQAWSKPGSLKPRGGHHLEPQGFKGLFVSGTVGNSIRKRGVASPCCTRVAPPPRHSVAPLQALPSAKSAFDG